MNYEITKGGKTALVFGASGLVGSHLVARLLDHDAYKQIVTFGRSDLGIVHHKLIHHIVDFDKIIDVAPLIKGDDLFCCIGTTRKKAGSKAAFRKVDYEYCIEVAHFAVVNNVSQFLLLSSVGANPKSFFLYSQVKGQLESDLKKLDFWSLHILQPSLLLGDREEFRLGEEISKMASKLIDKIFQEKLKSYRPISAAHLAQAMISIAQRLEKGHHEYASHELIDMAEEEGIQKV